MLTPIDSNVIFLAYRAIKRLYIQLLIEQSSLHILLSHSIDSSFQVKKLWGIIWQNTPGVSPTTEFEVGVFR